MPRQQQTYKTLANISSTFNPGVFQGTTMEFKPIDYSPLERGLSAMEARMNRAYDQQTAVDTALSEIETKLNPKEREWFATYKQDVKTQIQDEINAGNFGGAIRKATKLAGEVVNDSRITGRIEAQAKYKEEIDKQKDRVKRGEVDEDAYRWWLKNNEYKYEDAQDATGNVISGYEQAFTPLYDKLNVPSLAMSAFKLITAKKGSTAGDSQTTVNNLQQTAQTVGDKEYASGAGVTTSTHWSNQFEKISFDDIKANLEELIALTPGGFEQVEQAFNVALDKYKELEEQYEEAYELDPTNEKTRNLGQQLEARKKLLFKNGSTIGYDEYFARVVNDNLFAQNLAYNWTFTNSGNASSHSYHDVKSTSVSNNISNTPQPGYNYNPNTGYWEAPSVIMENSAGETISSVNNTAEQAGNRFDN